jgi:hypothetical protein
MMRPPHVRVPLAALGACLSLALTSAPVRAQTTAPADRQIMRVTGDLYRVQDGRRATVFLVAADGILLADPLDDAVARWLKSELETRFPDRTVRHVVQSYPTFDRASGGLVFRPAADIVGHASFNSAVAIESRVWPPSVAALDRNHDKRLDTGELAAAPDRAELLTHDINHDGEIKLGELHSQIAQVRTPFVDRHTISLGGKKIDIVNPGKAYAAGTTAILFTDERLLFSAESPLVTASTFSFGAQNARDLLAWAHLVTPLPFDTLLSGRGETMSRAEFEGLVGYLEALVASVENDYKAGLSLAEMQARPAPDQFRASPHAPGRPAHIAAVYDTLTVVDTSFQVAAIASWFSRSTTYCASSFDTCASGGLVPGGAIGLRVAAGRLGAVVELSSGGQFTSHRESVLYDDAFAHRSARGSFLVRRGTTHPNDGTTDLLVGVSVSVGSSQGLARVKEGFAPFAGRRPLEARPIGFGLTFGADIVRPIKNRRSLIVPVRVTFTPTSSDDLAPGRFDAQVGVGFRLGLGQRFK